MEQFQGTYTLDRERLSQMPRRFRKELSRLNGPSQDQQDAVHVGVPLLELGSASDRLRVSRGRLGLNAVPPTRPVDERIP